MRAKHAGRPSVDNANLADRLDPGEPPVANGPEACRGRIRADPTTRVTGLTAATTTANAARREGESCHAHPSRRIRVLPRKTMVGRPPGRDADGGARATHAHGDEA